MGLYINAINGKKPPAKGKSDFIIENIPGTIVLSAKPQEWEDGLVCVVDNGPFEAAAYAFDADEMEVFKNTNGRPSKWLLVPNAKDYAK